MSTPEPRQSALSKAADVASITSAVILVVVMVVMLTAIHARISGRTSAAAGVRPQAAGRAPTPPRGQPVSVVSGLDTSLKAHETTDGAQVVVIEYTDYECPFCGRYAREVYPRLRSEFFEAKTVAHFVRSFPLEAIHADAFRASMAAECAREQRRFWDMYDRLFLNQAELAAERLPEHAAALNLDRAAFERCLAGDSGEAVRSDMDEGRRLGVRSTPTFFIGVAGPDGKVNIARRVVGAHTYETFKTVINEVRTAGRSGN